MVRSLSKTKTGKISAPQILFERRKETKIPQGARRGVRTEEIIDFKNGIAVECFGAGYHE